MSAWLPNEVQAPSANGKFVQPKNWAEYKEGKETVRKYRFRVLSPAVAGLVGWMDGNKPIRARSAADFPPGQKWRQGEKTRKDGTKYTAEETPREFWAFAVWDYETAEVKVFEVSQKALKDGIREVVGKWGPPMGYDLEARATGKGVEVKYGIVNLPPTPIPADAQAAWSALESAGFDLNRLFDGGDPFPAAAPAASPAPAGDGGRPEIPF